MGVGKQLRRGVVGVEPTIGEGTTQRGKGNHNDTTTSNDRSSTTISSPGKTRSEIIIDMLETPPFSFVYRPAHSLYQRLVAFITVWHLRFWLDVFFVNLGMVHEWAVNLNKGLWVQHFDYGDKRYENGDVILDESHPELHPVQAYHHRRGSTWSVHESEEDLHFHEPMSDKLPVVYVHGGAWISVCKDLIRPYTTFLARAGHKTYNVDYPRAPENPFPVALVSILKMLSILKKQGHNRVILVGDSAGGNLVTLATMLLTSPAFLHELATHTEERIESWTYPDIDRVVVLYGLIDSHTLDQAGFIPAQAMTLIRNVYQNTEVLQGRFTPMDFPEYINDNLPPFFMVCGTLDPLCKGNKCFYDYLLSQNVEAHIEIYPGEPHGFLSMFTRPGRYIAQERIIHFCQKSKDT